MKIANRTIGGSEPPYIIAEISGNHAGSLDNAIKLMRAAHRAGADAVKTQCYEPDTITLNCNRLGFIMQDGLWKGQTLYDIYKKAHTPFSWHNELYRIAHNEGITIFSSIFDRSSVDLLQHLKCPAFKVASFEIVDTPLIEYAHSTGKPLIISTGMASDTEIKEANVASGGNAAFLHCTSEYPGTIESSDLDRISRLMGLLDFKNPVGISDHTATPAWVVPVMATAFGASIIEKHIKLADVPSEDDSFSLTPEEFAFMASCVRRAYQAIRPCEGQGGASRQARRSLYAVKDIKKDEIYTKNNIRSIRPGWGLPPKMYPKLLGMKANKTYKRGDPLS